MQIFRSETLSLIDHSEADGCGLCRGPSLTLEQLFANQPFLALNHIPELVQRFLTVADPVTLTYPLRLDVDRHVHPKVFDVEVEIEDPAMKGPKGNSVLSAFMEEGGREILQLDDEVRRRPCLSFCAGG